MEITKKKNKDFKRNNEKKSQIQTQTSPHNGPIKYKAKATI